MKKIVLVDGNNLLFRSYYATAYNGVIMRNSKGFPTNAVYGFLNMINKIIEEETPSYMIVAFDRGKTFRHEQYDWYKAGRRETPQDLIDQFPIAKEFLDYLGIFHYEIDNYEADDIIGTIAKKIDEEPEFLGTIISSDKDLLQLISPKVVVKLLKQSSHILMNVDTFHETYGIDPINMIDLKALMGDSSDNIPGVKGIGEKTALQLLQKYKTLDGIYECLPLIGGKTEDKLRLEEKQAYMSYDIATIYREVPLEFSLEDLKIKPINYEEYLTLLEVMEFNSLIRKLNQQGNIPQIKPKESKKDVKKVIYVSSLSQLVLDEDYAFYLDTIGSNYHDCLVRGVSFYNEKVNYYVPFDLLKDDYTIFNSTLAKYTYDVKKAVVIFNRYHIPYQNLVYDAMIATYLLNYDVKDDVAHVAKYFDHDIPYYEDVFGTEKRPKKVEDLVIYQISCDKAMFIFETKIEILQRLEKEEQLHLYQDIEFPLAFVLAKMEIEGIYVDKGYLEEMGKELKVKIDDLAKDIYEFANMEFNILSTKQLGEILFEKMAIPYPKRVKDGTYSTSKDILEKLIGVHPIIEKILEYRTLSKLYANYTVGLIDEIRDDGKIHTIYTQTLTRTGRLSSVSPNLQNIPAKLEYGRLVRKAFIPRENGYLLSSDYSQIELRMFAHMSQAENLILAFKSGEDIHTKTAADIFKVDITDVTKEMRRAAKAVNFGIIYGISSFGLSEDLKIDLKSAKDFIDTYLDTYPGIREYMSEEVKDAYRDGFVKTIMNRKRNIEELHSKNYMVRQQGERMALNTPVQGSAADILKKAMLEIDKEFSKRHLKSKMLLQVHDELVFDCLENELEEIKELVRGIMENVYPLLVPLKVEISIGKNWYEAK